MTLRAYALNCTLKSSPSVSSTDVIISQVADELGKHDAKTETMRAVDHRVQPRRRRHDLLGGRGDAGHRLQGPRPGARQGASTTSTMVANAVHLARALQGSPYPPPS